MKIKYKIKKLIYITENNEKIEVELKDDASYFLEINMIDNMGSTKKLQDLKERPIL